MLNEETISKALTEIISKENFQIKQIEYDESNFGNVLIELVSSNCICIKFIRDRGNLYCEAGINQELYFIEDIFSLIGISILDTNSETEEYLKSISKLIASNITAIFSVFDAKNFEDTEIKLKAIATQRVVGMFN